MPKPAFDPNKPFQVAQEEKPAFDPNQPFESDMPKAGSSLADSMPTLLKDLISARAAFQNGVIKGGTMNYIDPNKMNKASDEQPIAASIGQAGGTIAPSMAFGAGAAPLVAKVGKLGSIAAPIARTAINAGTAGLEAFARKPEGDDGLLPRMENAKQAMKIGALVSGGLEAAIPVANGIAGAGKKVWSALTNVPEDLIANYAKRTDDVNKIIKESGGDMTAAADKLRTDISGQVQSTRRQLSGQITKALNEALPEKNIEIAPVLDTLQKVRARLNPNLKSEEVAAIDDLIDKVGKEAQDGKVSLAQLHEIKEFLSDRAKSAYQKGGQIFINAKDVALAAKQGAAIARKTLNPLAPEIADANNKLSALHTIEDSLNKNLIAAGKPDGALFAAGAGQNARNQRLLGRLGDATGNNIVDKARDLATAREFANPSLLPTDKTGKAAARLLTAGGIGSLIAGPVGAAAGAAVASPMTLKAGINMGNVVAKLGGKLPLGALNPQNAMAVQSLAGLAGNMAGDAPLGSTNGQIDPRIIEEFEKNPKLLENVTDPVQRASIEQLLRNRSPSGSAIHRRLKSR